MIAHLAPQWNQVENYLIQGRNFLVTSTPLNAVKLELGVNDDSVFVVLWPMRVHMTQSKFEDLDVPPLMTQEFLTQPTASISDMTMGAQFIHVLPSLKKARIVTVSRQIPDSCPYTTYKELKRHWKNSYGYRLPEVESDVIYYTLSFHPMFPTKYTYPSVCTVADRPTLLSRVDQTFVLRSFLSDLARKMPNVCGQPFAVNSQLGYAVTRSQQGRIGQEANKLGNALMPKGLVPIDPTFLTSGSTMVPPSQVDMFATPRTQMPPSSAAPSTAPASRDVAPSPHILTSTITSTTPSVPQTSHQDGPRSKYVPIFHPPATMGSQRHTKTHLSTAGDTKPMVPAFMSVNSPRPALTADRGMTPMLPDSSTESPCSRHVTKPSVFVPSFSMQARIPLTPRPVHNSMDDSTKSKLSSQMEKSVEDWSWKKAEIPRKTPCFAPQFKASIFSGSEPRMSGCPSAEAVSQMKRSAASPSSTVDTGAAKKKPRSKPQVQANVDVEALARDSRLATVNAATLMSWLNEKGVKCTSREKKPDLIDKVTNYLNTQAAVHA